MFILIAATGLLSPPNSLQAGRFHVFIAAIPLYSLIIAGSRFSDSLILCFTLCKGAGKDYDLKIGVCRTEFNKIAFLVIPASWLET